MKHLNVRWNPATNEWFCPKCGRTSDHANVDAAHVELDQYECEISPEGSIAAAGTENYLALGIVRRVRTVSNASRRTACWNPMTLKSRLQFGHHTDETLHGSAL